MIRFPAPQKGLLSGDKVDMGASGVYFWHAIHEDTI